MHHDAPCTGQKRWQKDKMRRKMERTFKHSAANICNPEIQRIVDFVFCCSSKFLQIPYIFWLPWWLPCGFSVARWSVLLLRDGSKMQRLDQTRFPRAHGLPMGHPCVIHVSSMCHPCVIHVQRIESYRVHDPCRWRELLIWRRFGAILFTEWRYSVKDFSSKAEESINRLTEDRKDSLFEINSEGVFLIFSGSISKEKRCIWLIHIDPLKKMQRFSFEIFLNISIKSCVWMYVD